MLIGCVSLARVNLVWVSLAQRGCQAPQAQLASLEKRGVQDCLAYVASKASRAYLGSKDSEVTSSEKYSSVFLFLFFKVPPP